MDGSGGGDIVTTGATVNGPAGVSVDPAAGRIYWANSGGGSISFANLNGSGGGDIVTTGATVNQPVGVALDPAAGRIYWANFVGGSSKISYANLNGTGGGDVVTTGATVDQPAGVAVDSGAGRVYWGNQTGTEFLRKPERERWWKPLATLGAPCGPVFPSLLKTPVGTGNPAITGTTRRHPQLLTGLVGG